LIVLAASAAVFIFLNIGPEAGHIRQRIVQSDETLHVPHVFDVEVLHVLRRYSLSGTLSESRGRLALSRLSSTRLTRYPHASFVRRIWELRHNLTAYDAAYVALAEALDAPLVTMDARLAQAPGHSAAVELYE
jgi:predicted nucleic acid-binding protein